MYLWYLLPPTSMYAPVEPEYDPATQEMQREDEEAPAVRAEQSCRAGAPASMGAMTEICMRPQAIARLCVSRVKTRLAWSELAPHIHTCTVPYYCSNHPFVLCSHSLAGRRRFASKKWQIHTVPVSQQKLRHKDNRDLLRNQTHIFNTNSQDT